MGICGIIGFIWRDRSHYNLEGLLFLFGLDFLFVCYCDILTSLQYTVYYGGYNKINKNVEGGV